MKALRVLSVLGACAALTLAVGCNGGTDDGDGATNGDTTANGDTPGSPTLEGGEGQPIGDE